jgi:NAD-dependent SIR2 family protein deacetylase
MTVDRAGYSTRQGVTLRQPIPFSHDHHVGGLGIDCRYCHTSVEKSAFAGIPPTSTCINCHKLIWKDSPMLEPVRASFRTGEPIRWTRVHDLPDFTYFNHSIHISKGVGCVTCHGRVDTMPLMRQVSSLQMRWCLDCHRNPEQVLRPRSEIFNMKWNPENQEALGRDLAKEYQIRSVQGLTSCSTCHH